MEENVKDKLNEDYDFLQKANENLINSIEEFKLINNRLIQIVSERDPDRIVEHFFDTIEEIGIRSDFKLFLYDKITNELKERANPNKPSSVSNSLPISEDVLEWVKTGGKITTVPLEDEEEKLITIVPLIVGRNVVGFLFINVFSDDFITQQNIERLELIANQTAGSLENATLYATLEREHKTTEENKTFLENILEGIHNGIITLDLDKKITHINRNVSAMFQMESLDVVGEKFEEVLTPEAVELINDMLSETLEIGFSMDRQLTVTTQEGIEIPLGISTMIMRDENFQPKGFIITSRDMTATREMERLRKIDKMKSEFVSNVSHELRTPLTSIKAYTEALMGMIEDETQSEFLNVVNDESDRLLELIENLLNVSRIESGKLVLDEELVSPEEIIEEIVSISKVQSEKHELVTNYEPDLPEIYVDKNKLKEVIINLVSNAIKYSPEGGKVEVKVYKQEKNVRFDVTDEGMGISEENLKKIFDQFFRVDSSLTYEISGTGLGLAICKAIVEAHKGVISVESEVGKGSTFSVIIPLKPKKKKSTEPPPELDELE